MFRSLFAAVIGSLALLASVPCSASLIRTFNFSALVIDWSFTTTPNIPAPGTTLAGSFSYDLQAPRNTFNTDHFDHPVTQFALDSLISPATPAGSSIAVNNDVGPAFALLDQFVLAANFAGFQVEVRLRDETGLAGAFTSSDLPDTLSLSQFYGNGTLLAWLPEGKLYAKLTSLEPAVEISEPSVLVLAALSALALLRSARVRSFRSAP